MGPWIIRTERGYLLRDGTFHREMQQFHEHMTFADFAQAQEFCNGYRVGAGPKSYAMPVQWPEAPPRLNLVKLASSS